MKIAFVVPDNRDEFGQFELPAPVFGPAPQALLDGFSQLPECEIHVISTTRQPTANPPKLAANVFFHSLKLSPWARLRSLNAGSTLAIRRVLREIRPDIVHGQGSERYPAVAAAFSGYPNVVTLHGIMSQLAGIQNAAPFSWPQITGWLERRAVRRADAVVCLSNHARSAIRRLAKQAVIIPNAVADRFFTIRRVPAETVEIICPAHIYAIKNQPALIRALDPLASRIQFKLTFLGKLTGDKSSHEVQQLAASRPWCHIAGGVDSAGIKEALARATLLVLPSLEENCPVALLEGMAAGIPIAASRAGGIPDLIRDGVTGLLFDPREPDSIRSSIERLLFSPTFANELASAARQHAEGAFRPKNIAARHLDLYSELLR